MERFARWFAFLGIVSALPAAVLLGSGVGELLRRPAIGLSGLVEREAVVIGLAVVAVFLIRTAAGLRAQRTWALHLGLGLSGLVVLGGLGGLVLGGAVLEALGLDRQLVLGTVPLSLGALLLGARLAVGLLRCAELSLPFDWRDARALGTLGAILVVGLVSHLVVRGLAG